MPNVGVKAKSGGADGLLPGVLGGLRDHVASGAAEAETSR